jgi:hypothetical protein
MLHEIAILDELVQMILDRSARRPPECRDSGSPPYIL